MNNAADPCPPVLDEPAQTDGFAAQLESWRTRMERALEERLPPADVVAKTFYAEHNFPGVFPGK